MKPAVLAPMYACIYPGLCDIARNHGYALTIHGTMQRDVDMVAIPWVDDAKSEEELVAAIKSHLGALYLVDRLRADLPAGAEVTEYEGRDPTSKPHGRKAYSLYLDHGAYIDLSVMPRSKQFEYQLKT